MNFFYKCFSLFCCVYLPVSQLRENMHGLGGHTPRICNLTSLISWVRLFVESDVSDSDNIVPFENTAPINQNKTVKIKESRED